MSGLPPVIAAITGGKPLKDGIDGDAVEGAVNNPYAIANQRIEYVQTEPKVLNLGWWRGVGPNNAVFAIESMMDDLAKKAGKDPVAFRLAHLGNEPRLKAILQIAAERSGWGDAVPDLSPHPDPGGEEVMTHDREAAT